MEISPDEHTLLKQYVRTTTLILVRSKAQAVLMREKGMTFSDIGDIISRDRRTVSEWIGDWEARRMASIFTGHANNENAAKLTRKERDALQKVLNKPPSEQGLPKTFWDVPTLKSYTQAAFGIVYESPRSYHLLLRFSNLSFKYPDTFDLRRDESKIKARMAEIRLEIEPFLNDPVWKVFTSDEVRIELEALTRRAWLKRGEKTVLKVNRVREAQSYIGFLDQETYSCITYRMTWQDQDEVIRTLKLLLKRFPNKKICIIWDNAAFHKGKRLRQALAKGGELERVHLIPLPPYAPDENPIEHVWKDAKGAIANTQHDTLANVTHAFERHIRRRTFSYHL